MISIIKSSDKLRIKKIIERSRLTETNNRSVKKIIDDVKKNGDNALIKYSKKFDKLNLPASKIQISKKEIKDAYKKVNPKIIKSLKIASDNISRFAKYQIPQEWKKEINKGILVGQLVRPLDSVGCYVPGGNYPLVSTVLMTVIPAKIAGVKEILVCCPNITKEIIVACDLTGATKIFRVGGPQAIAAMAYGTKTIPKVNKIVGPGNVYVTIAKKLVNGDTGIDFLAGPTEVMILAKEGNPVYIAADMLAQAEHDNLASSILVTPNNSLAKKVNIEIKKQLNGLDTKKVARKSLKNYGAIVIVKNMDEAFDFANDFAPEHLEIMTDDETVLSKIKNAGSIFLGEYSPEAAGDYSSGPNHVLPTMSTSKIRAGLSVTDFVKTPSFQKLSKSGLKSIKNSIIDLAEIEGLDGHAKSIMKRFENDQS